jgi:hypothetical protein
MNVLRQAKAVSGLSLSELLHAAGSTRHGLWALRRLRERLMEVTSTGQELGDPQANRCDDGHDTDNEEGQSERHASEQ